MNGLKWTTSIILDGPDMGQELNKCCRWARDGLAKMGTENAAVLNTTSDPITGTDVTAAGGWLYNATTGEIRINEATGVTY